jgi:hypothetical protein
VWWSSTTFTRLGLATVELLHYLIRHAGNARLLVVATVRSEEGAPVLAALTDVAERLELGPLPPAAVAELSGVAGHPELADVIAARTGGHPLFVVETLDALVGGDTGIPESLQAAVLSRVRLAGDRTEEVLRAAAVLGAAIEPETLAHMLDISPVAASPTARTSLPTTSSARSSTRTFRRPAAPPSTGAPATC